MNIKKILRLEQWWGHILPPILLFYYVGLLQNTTCDKSDVFIHMLFILFLSVITAFAGYFLNDLSDIEEDKKAGKKNYVVNFPRWLKIFFLPIIFLLLILSLKLISIETSIREIYFYTIVILLNTFLFAIYSIPPFRMKRFPVPAIILDALYSGVLFYILSFYIGLSIHDINSKAGVPCIFNYRIPVSFILILAWGFLKGIRNYLTHLADDREHDIQSGLETFSTKFGSKKIQRLANFIYPFEMIILIFFFSLQKKISVFTIIPCILFLLLWTRSVLKNAAQKQKSLNDLYEVWLPLLLLIGLIVLNPSLYFLLIMHLLFFPYHLYKIYCLLDRIYYHTIFKMIGPVRKMK